MKIGMSACLAGRNCKYNGKNNLNEKVMKQFENDKIILVCPEQLGGLDTPRIPCEIRSGRVVNREGTDVTEQFEQGADAAFELVKDCDLVVLQPRSPSCGASHVYDGTFSGKLVEGCGIFAKKCKMSNIPIMEAESEK